MESSRTTSKIHVVESVFATARFTPSSESPCIRSLSVLYSKSIVGAGLVALTGKSVVTVTLIVSPPIPVKPSSTGSPSVRLGLVRFS